MAVLKHPISGATYTLQDDGLVRVENNGMAGLFHPDGRHHSGAIRQADPQLVWWLGMPELPTGRRAREHR